MRRLRVIQSYRSHMGTLHIAQLFSLTFHHGGEDENTLRHRDRYGIRFYVHHDARTGTECPENAREIARTAGRSIANVRVRNSVGRQHGFDALERRHPWPSQIRARRHQSRGSRKSALDGDRIGSERPAAALSGRQNSGIAWSKPFALELTRPDGGAAKTKSHRSTLAPTMVRAR